MITTAATSAQEIQETKVSDQTKERIIAVCCLTFFPLVYLIGKTLVSWF